MTVNTIDSAALEPGATPRAELLVAAVLHLMSQYSANRDQGDGGARLAAVIERHLKVLAGLPDLAPVLRASCSLVTEQWSVMAKRPARPATGGGLMSRLMSPFWRKNLRPSAASMSY